MSTDPQCNPFVIGNSSILHSGESGFFIQKYDPALANVGIDLILGPNTGLESAVGPSSIALDQIQNIYLSGTAKGPRCLWGHDVAGQYGAWYAVYGPTGSKQIRSDALSGVEGTTTFSGGLALDPAGNIYIGGYSDGVLQGSQTTGGFLAQYRAFSQCNQVKGGLAQIDADGCDVHDVILLGGGPSH